MWKRERVESWVGLDIDDAWTHGYVLDSRGQIRESKKMSTPKMECKKWLAEQPRPCHVMFEESTLAQWFFESLVEEMEKVVVCEPRENAWVNKSNKKNDPRDAYKVAELLRLNRYKPVYHSMDPRRVELRRQAKHYITMRKEMRRWKCRIQARFKEFGIFPDSKLFKDKKIQKKWLRTLSKRAARRRVKREIEIFEAIESQREAALRSLNAYAVHFPEIERVRGVPGVGKVGAPMFIGLIMDPGRFPNRQSLWTYCRLGITSSESGGEKTRPDKIDRWNGHGALKDVSRKAFMVAERTGNIFYEYYLEKAKEKSGYKARLTTQRKILTAMWQSWLKKEEFKPCEVI